MLFSEVIGHNHIKQRLTGTVKNSRISHAQLFLGPEGSGKLALALAYAQFINCENKIQQGLFGEEYRDDSCGLCPSCIKYQKLIHPDLHFIFPVATTKEVTKNPLSKAFLGTWRSYLQKTGSYPSLNEWYEEIGIENKQGIINAEECNEIIKSLSLKSYESEYKVVIMWMVEKLHYAAAPKLLKILEEPPDKTLFLLISENQSQIINTILSRTQLVKIPPIPDDVMREFLLSKNAYGEEAVEKAVNLAEGNFCTAKFYAENPNEERNNFDLFVNWMRKVYMLRFQELIPITEDIARIGRERQKNMLSYAIRMFRYCLLYNYQSHDLIRLTKPEMEFLQKFSALVNPKNGNDIIHEFNSAIANIERNVNPRILFLDLSLTMYTLLKRGQTG